MVFEDLHPVLQLILPVPRRRHRDRENDEGVSVVFFVESESQEIQMTGIAVENPHSESREI